MDQVKTVGDTSERTPAGWDQVKAFFMAEARRLGEEWFG